MVPSSEFFLNPIAWAAYAVVAGGALFVTYRRVRECPGRAPAGLVIFTFLLTLLVLSVSTTVLGFVFFTILILSAHLFIPSLERAFLAVILGPALCGLIAASLSLFLASRLSRFIWATNSPGKGASPPLDQ
jgi:hypothetical protein